MKSMSNLSKLNYSNNAFKYLFGENYSIEDVRNKNYRKWWLKYVDKYVFKYPESHLFGEGGALDTRPYTSGEFWYEFNTDELVEIFRYSKNYLSTFESLPVVDFTNGKLIPKNKLDWQREAVNKIESVLNNKGMIYLNGPRQSGISTMLVNYIVHIILQGAMDAYERKYKNGQKILALNVKMDSLKYMLSGVRDALNTLPIHVQLFVTSQLGTFFCKDNTIFFNRHNGIPGFSDLKIEFKTYRQANKAAFGRDKNFYSHVIGDLFSFGRDNLEQLKSMLTVMNNTNNDTESKFLFATTDTTNYAHDTELKERSMALVPNFEFLNIEHSMRGDEQLIAN